MIRYACARQALRSLLTGFYLEIERTARKERFEQLRRTGRVFVGTNTYGWPDVLTFTGDETVVRIGAYCSIARDVTFVAGGNHNSDWISTFPLRARLGLEGAYKDGQPSSKGDILIGSDVWLGSGATVLSGVSVGDGAVIGARAVVTRDVPPYAIVAGNPAGVRRYRFSEGQIARLLDVAWWRWDEDVIKRHVDLLSSTMDDSRLSRLEVVAREVATQPPRGGFL